MPPLAYLSFALKGLYLDMRWLSTLSCCFFLDFSIATINKTNANFILWMAIKCIGYMLYISSACLHQN